MSGQPYILTDEEKEVIDVALGLLYLKLHQNSGGEWLQARLLIQTPAGSVSEASIVALKARLVGCAPDKVALPPVPVEPPPVDPPRFTHDCDACIYLGQYNHSKYKRVDLYYCPKEAGGPTVLARFGSDGGAYSSFTVESVKRGFADEPKHPYNEAIRRFEAKPTT